MLCLLYKHKIGGGNLISRNPGEMARLYWCFTQKRLAGTPGKPLCICARCDGQYCGKIRGFTFV